MDAAEFFEDAAAHLVEHPNNRISEGLALREDLIGLRIYDAPLFAVGDAADPLFSALRDPSVVHPGYLVPTDWMPDARSVVSIFAPFSQAVYTANAEDFRYPADEWLHARFEGEQLLVSFRLHLCEQLREMGYQALSPQQDARYTMLAEYAPNWSERHTGYVCGQGTFGLSKGLITKKGMAGRLGSFITNCALPVTTRAYSGINEYCTECNECVAHCPVRCIDPARGAHRAKENPPCDAFLAHIREKSEQETGLKRYGCGKCQVAVPCGRGIPEKNR